METYRLADDSPETEPTVFADVWPGLNRFSQRLDRILTVVPSTTPVLLSGDWGSGKTTLLRAVQRRMAEKRTVIWFEAWRYDGQGSLLPALMRTVWDAAPPDWKNGQEPDFFEKLIRSAMTVGMKAAPAVLQWAGVPILPQALTAMQMQRPPEPAGGKRGWEPPPDPVQEMWESFSRLVLEAWQGQLPPMILIDDLDRCDPAGMVAVLEHVRILVSSAPELHCRFVVAIDRSIVVQAVGRKFEGISGYDGNRYLEKVFPLSFNLPAPTSQEVSRLIDHVWGRNNAPADRDHRDFLTQALREPVFANPRLIKRVVNKYRLMQQLEETEGDATVASRNRYLARWIAATERWPRLRPLLVRQPEDYWDQLQKQLAGGISPDPEADALLREQGARAWVQRELLKDNPRANLLHYRDAEGRLQSVGL